MKHKNIAFFIPHLGCPHCCSFCDQRAISGNASAPSPESVRKTLEEAFAAIEDRENCEIAFFGGSFTAIPKEQMLSYLKIAQPFCGEGGFGGIRVSTRPDAVDEEILLLLKEHGVTVIELGAQSMRDEVLIKNGRGHTAKDVRDAARRVKAKDFSLGLQMMVGLPGDTNPGDALFTAEELIALKPDFVRIYPAVILPHTQMAKWFQSGEYIPMWLDTAVSVCAELLLRFGAAKIPVIRLGLHDSPDVAQNHIGGIYHPAFRELCESKIWLDRMTALLADQQKGSYTFFVPVSCVSKAVGQHRTNIKKLREAGYTARVCGDPTLRFDEIKLKGGV